MSGASDYAAIVANAKAVNDVNRARSQGIDQDNERRNQQKRNAATRFVARHRQAGWTVAESGVPPTLTKFGHPTLTDPNSGATVTPGMLYEYDGGLYIKDDGYPFGVDLDHDYPRTVGGLMWWDGGRGVYLYRRIAAGLEALAHEWHEWQAARHPQPDTGRGRRRKLTS